MNDRRKGDGIAMDPTVTSSARAAAGEQPRDIAAGTIVADRYEIVRLIARGGMGAVYEAQDLSLQQRVALKTIRSERGSDSRAVERFKREALLARRVTHRNVCRVFDVGYHDDDMFLTMELLAGETLADRLRRAGPMTPDEALPLVEQMVAALAAAHHAGVVHRDLKCSNVMLADGRVVVTDFGLAHDATAADHEGSRDGFLGSPAYVAPEQVGGRRVTFAADIYALGVVMFEMLTGKLPFVGATLMATAVMRLNESPPSPRTLAPTIPERWERVILRCLERDPADRYAAITDVSAALAAQPVAAPAGERTRARRRTALVVGALVVVATLGAGALGWRALRHRTAAAVGSAEARGTLAVTDLDDRTGRADDAWRGAAFSELLAAQLGGSESVHLVPRERVRGHDRAQLARVGATLALGGSYRQEGEGLTFEVRIVDLRTDATVAAVVESGPRSELFDVAARTAVKLRHALGLPALSQAETAGTRSALPSNPDAARCYTEGVTALRRHQLVVAQHAFEAALAVEPDQPMVYSALATTWHELESDQKEREAAQRAFELSANLPREQRLSIEASYREALKDWSGAAQIRLTLATFFPDNLDYGLKLFEAQRRSGSLDVALETLARLRRLPPPDGDDPRIDLAEASARQRRDPQLALAAAQRAIEGARRRGAVSIEAEAHVIVCLMEGSAMHVDAAEAACQVAVRLFASENDKAGVARATVARAGIYVTAQRTAEANRYEFEALALYREIGSRVGEGRVRNQIAVAYKRRGDLVTSEKMEREAVDIFRSLGESQLMIKAMEDLAGTYTEQGRHAEATPLYRQIIETAHAQGLAASEANSMSNFSITLTRRGELVEARRFAAGAVALWRKMGRKNDAVFGMDSVEQITLRQGHIGEAEKIEEEALAIRESLGWIGGPSRQNLAELALEQGNLARAEALGQKAVEEFHGAGQRVGEAYALEVLLRILFRAGRIDDAAAALKRQDELIKQTGLPVSMFAGSHALYKASTGDLPGALAALRDTIAACEKRGDIDTAMDVRQVLADVLVHHGSRDEARRALASLRSVGTAHGYGLAVRDAGLLERELK